MFLLNRLFVIDFMFVLLFFLTGAYVYGNGVLFYIFILSLLQNMNKLLIKKRDNNKNPGYMFSLTLRTRFTS